MSKIASSSPTSPQRSLRGTGRVRGACPTSINAGGLTAPQHDDVVDPRPGAPVGTLGLTLDGVDPHAFPIVTEFQSGDNLLGTGEFVVAMVEFRRPRRRTRVVDNEKHSPLAHRGRCALE